MLYILVTVTTCQYPEIPNCSLIFQPALEAVNLVTWSATPRSLRSYIAVNRADIISVDHGHIQSHYGYLEELKLFSVHRRPINLASEMLDVDVIVERRRG